MIINDKVYLHDDRGRMNFAEKDQISSAIFIKTTNRRMTK